MHGFRSSFRDWAGDRTHYAREVIEHALAHQIKDKAEAAYRRSDALEKRRRLMEEWAKYCGSPVSRLRSGGAAWIDSVKEYEAKFANATSRVLESGRQLRNIDPYR